MVPVILKNAVVFKQEKVVGKLARTASITEKDAWRDGWETKPQVMGDGTLPEVNTLKVLIQAGNMLAT